jgi:hypothetical protein
MFGLLEHPGEDEEGEGIVLESSNPWEGSDRDYEYEEVCILFHFTSLPQCHEYSFTFIVYGI